MNETNQERIWELAAAKLHEEASESEINELKLSDYQKIEETISQLHFQLKQTTPLHHGSLIRSWEKIENYLKAKKINVYYGVTKYAAIVLLAFIAGSLFSYEWGTDNSTPPVFTEIQVPLGQMTEVTLYDGTHVWLNSGTTLRYPNTFGSKIRLVELEGEAFFKVKQDEIPFKVKIKNSEVKVMGTSFAAVAYPDEDFCQVTLVEGSVQINDQNGYEIKNLAPNQQLHLPDNPDEKIKLREVNTLFYESWINGQIKFEEEHLVDVARRMERWYNVEIRFNSKEAGELRFTGTVLKNKPVDQSMKAISMLLPITLKHERNLATKDVIIISKK